MLIYHLMCLSPFDQQILELDPCLHGKSITNLTLFSAKPGEFVVPKSANPYSPAPFSEDR